jgi:hypothetical protein
MTSSSNNAPDSAAGTPSAGFCAACGSALLAGGRFCHRCGTPVGQGTSGAHKTTGGSFGAILPWAVAFVALLMLVATFAGRNFGAARGSSVDGSSNALPTTAMDGGGAAPRAPDISSMSPGERASSLYNRIMTYAEQGQVDSVAFFAPMALGAHEMLTAPTIDERYHFGRIAELVDNGSVARAQADTILAAQPRSLLGLLLGARAARMTGDSASARALDKRFLDALQVELATSNEDYRFHRPEIDRAAQDARRAN